ncbi:unnamed protein product [Lactuca virosa]|uniref:RecA-like N-terminal domain-containing protein n=1 Tax=Lactuca virosa TaxID=75947 RepID=A0AAU9M541_9ASTR|nr:unnamed protein product [Lactuca virosa]
MMIMSSLMLGVVHFVASNTDCGVWDFDMEKFEMSKHFWFPWPVNLIVCQPDNGEMALEIADRMCRSAAVDLICIDSVSALTPRAEIEREIGMQQMSLQARLMSQALRKMSGNASKVGFGFGVGFALSYYDFAHDTTKT